jgi:hypothetical protein
MPAASAWLHRHTFTFSSESIGATAMGGPSPTAASQLTGVKGRLQQQPAWHTQRATPDLEKFVMVTHLLYTNVDLSTVKRGWLVTISASPTTAWVNRRFTVTDVRCEGDRNHVWTAYLKEQE